MNMKRAMLAALAVAALSTYQAWAVDVPGAVQHGAQSIALPNQMPPPSNTGANVTVPGAAQVTVGRPAVAGNQIAENRPDRWRYKFDNNRWWYYTPENRWMIYSDQYGWNYPESAGGYTTAYAAPVAPPAVEYTAPTTTYYTYPSYGYYYNGYRGRYYGRPGYYVGRPWYGYRRWW